MPKSIADPGQNTKAHGLIYTATARTTSLYDGCAAPTTWLMLVSCVALTLLTTHRRLRFKPNTAPYSFGEGEHSEKYMWTPNSLNLPSWARRWLAQGPGDGGYGKRCLLHKVEESQGPLSVFSQSLRRALARNSSAQDCLWKGLGTTRGFYKSDEREL